VTGRQVMKVFARKFGSLISSAAFADEGKSESL
jgi:hypothetical protein